MTQRKNWRAEAAFLREIANSLKVAMSEIDLDHPDAADILLKNIERLERRAEFIAVPPRGKGLSNE